MRRLAPLSLSLCLGLLSTSALAQTQVKPRVLIMVDTSGSMTQDLNNNNTAGDGSVYYQDSQMTLGSNVTTPNYSPYPGYASGALMCPPPANGTLGPTSKMASAKQAVTNVINGSGDVDWGLMRYIGARVAFPTALAQINRTINPDSVVAPNPNYFPVFCTTNAQCSSGTCDTASGRCTRQKCTASNQCATGQTCDTMTGQCGCTANADCGTNALCTSNECRGMGGSKCTANTQCASGTCGKNGVCTCNANNQCSSNFCGVNTFGWPTGECLCTNSNQCPSGGTCKINNQGVGTYQCTATADTQCPSGKRLGTTTECACTSNAQCPSGSCDTNSGRCLCTQGSDCRSGTCRTTTGECTCNSNAECWGAAACDTNSHECYTSTASDCPSGTLTGNDCACNTTTAKCLNGETCTNGKCGCTTNSQCRNGGLCQGGTCTNACNTENDCSFAEWCVGGQCGVSNTLAYGGTHGNATAGYGETDSRGGLACGNHDDIKLTYAGSCGTDTTSGGTCVTAQSCFADTDCKVTTAGNCALIGAGPAKSCKCGSALDCPTDYTCTNGRCAYNLGCVSAGGTILVDPTAAGYAATQILPFVDGVEIFTDNGSGGITNPELRADGATPLGGAARTATAWYNSIASASTSSSLYDPKLLCRPYIFVMMTDGADTCDAFSSGMTNYGDSAVGPVAGVQGFIAATASGARVTNKVEVIGLSISSATDQAVLDNMAKAGSSARTTARYANNQSDIEAALADIVAASVLYEVCNGQDDTCDGLVDEGLGVYQECVPGNTTTCMAGTCDSTGRCPCNGTLQNQCSAGFACNSKAASGGYCVPTCAVGVGACERDGVRKCGGSCCVNDGQTACTAVVAGAPSTEICNNIDDNCNGQIDEGNVCSSCQPTVETCNGKDDNCNTTIDDNLVDTGLSCGTNVGECKPGTTACQPTSGTFPNSTDHIVCVGAVGPTPEVCDGKDNNCDGVIDGMTQACYSGPAATRNVGVCRDGSQMCNAAVGSGVSSYGACTGEVDPTTEVCDGLDNDCDGKIDDVSGTGGTCCTSGKCGVGICVAGTLECSGGAIACVGEVGPAQEICDGLDNDCNGTVDDVPGLGGACTPSTGTCGGHLACDTTAHTLTCVPDAPMPEVCNGIDDDCDGIIDNPNEVPGNDPRIGVACDAPVAPANLPPCKAGTTVCVNGQVDCQGEVGPSPNVCGQASTDCQSSGVFNGNCPSGFSCFDGTCVAPCSSGEFPCPGGFLCQNNFCIPDACAKTTCPSGQICQVDSSGNAQCIDPCASVTCPSGFACQGGLCVDDTCTTFGCPTGQVCVNSACQADPCTGKTCDDNQYCDPANGNCVTACAGPCPSGEECVDGMCETDPCAHKSCGAGEACMVTQGVGMCVSASCGMGTCSTGNACCGGSCIIDPCASIACPSGATCSLTSDCNATCVSPAIEKIVGAGGGGFACDVAGVGSRRNATSGYGLLLAAIALVMARRRRVRA